MVLAGLDPSGGKTGAQLMVINVCGGKRQVTKALAVVSKYVAL
jgi:hypothetical protein